MDVPDNKNILFAIVGLIFIFVAFKTYNSYSNKIDRLFKSHYIPYIPKNINLKDKDNKIIRHLKFRFVYTCSSNQFNLIVKSSKRINNVQSLFYFKKNNDIWVGFFVVDTELISTPDNGSDQITEYPYKLYDTYVMGETRIFNDIEDILINQGYDRDSYGDRAISTTYLNEICSNKIEYIRYFLKHKLMLGTWIKPYRKNQDNVYPNLYVKAPYSSRSACASLNKIDSDLCYLADGIIVQEENKMLGKYEIKCYVIDGQVTMTIVRLGGRNVNICVPDDMRGVDPEIRNIIERYRDMIEETCIKTYYYTNALISMRVAKLENDEKEAEVIINDLKNAKLDEPEYLRIRYILTGLVNSIKRDLISDLNKKYTKSYDVGKFTRRVVDYPDPIENISELLAYDMNMEKFTELMQSIKIYDRFMRVDMALPDIDESGIYDRITVTEIEPLASGIYLYKTIGPCMKDDDMNTFDNIVKYNLHSIISSIEK
jgi:hypothetical protein